MLNYFMMFTTHDFRMKIKMLFVTFFISSYVFGARGDLISAEILATKSLINAQTYIDNELAQIVSDMFSIEPAQYGYWLYKITYETIDQFGDSHIATGVVSYPRVDWPEIPDQAFPMISYQHGTVVEKSSVTSVNGEWILSAILTTSGYVYAEPDYLGLGDSEGRHPYQLKEPYGTACVDLFRAIRQYSEQNDQFTLNDQLFLAGYSEGGYATMALHNIIERDYSNEFQITYSFPMAGAYSMSGIMVDVMLDMQPYGEPFYFPYVLFAYIDAYTELDSPESYLLPQYHNLYDMFDGFHASSEINASMPNIPITIMKPDSIDSFESNQNHPLRLALKENDLWNWMPIAPIHIFHGIGDELVPVENSEMAYEQFINNGSQNIQLELIPESFGGHQDVAPWALFGAYQIAKDYQMINELGDMNQDGGYDILDIVKIANLILLGPNSEYASYSFWAADLNMDESINIQDIVILIDMILYNNF